MDSELKKSVKTLASALKKDKDFYYSYQANIAVCMQDAANEAGVKISKKKLDEISNEGAKRFLDLFCNT